MDTLHRSWRLGTALVPLEEVETLGTNQLDALEREVANAPDDALVKVRADLFRTLLAGHRRPRSERRVVVEDQARGVTYLVGVGHGDGRVWPEVVEVRPWDPSTTTPDIWRIPAQTLATRAALVLDEQEEMDPDTPESVIMWGQPSPCEGVPTPGELRQMLRDGLTRAQIARKTGRSVSRVDDWLREARRDRPDLDWPARRRGPKPHDEGSEVTK